jgi:hypothetical protein
MSNQPNFEKIDTVTSGYFTYIVGHFRQPDLYVLGVMDLDDPASWSGGETTTVFYFMITPEEFSWLENDRSKLDILATQIQTKMPRNRFFSATSRQQTTPEALKAKCDGAVKSEALDDDEAFVEWKKTVRFPQTVRVPATPFNKARHALAIRQKGFDPRKATPEEAAEEEDLEKKLGWLIFKAEELYVAYDSSFNPRFPLLETVTGDVHLFSTQQLAERSVQHYEEAHQYYSTVKKLTQEEIKPFLRFCEHMGVLRFRVDDGLEPVTVFRRNIIPDSNPGFIERHNCAIRNSMLRTLQTLQLFTRHQEEMTPEWKTGLNNWFMTWNRIALQDLGNTTLFALCAAPEQLREQFKPDHVYSSQGIERIQELMRKADAVGSPIAKPNFTGKHRILSTKDGKYPIRMVKNNQTEQFWLVAFTSREDAVQFAEQFHYPDLVVGLSLDELTAHVGENAGVLVDPTGVSMTLMPKVLEQALKVRSEGRVIYRPQPAQKPADGTEAPAEGQETAPEETPAEAPAPVPTAQEEASQDVPTVELSDEAECSDETDSSGEEKSGFFSRFFK